MRYLTAFLALIGTPALAADGPFFSLANSDFVVLISFLIFIGILVYFKVPAMIVGMLDQRAETIQSEIDEARKLREEAKELLAEFERKHQDVQAQADRIVTAAREEAEAAAAQAKDDLQKTIARRMSAAQDQIASAEASAIKEVRDQASVVAVAAARAVIAQDMTDQDGDALIDAAIAEAQTKLH